MFIFVVPEVGFLYEELRKGQQFGDHDDPLKYQENKAQKMKNKLQYN